VRPPSGRTSWSRKNREIDWHPEHVGEGRFGNWLENVVDWALSRKRYWGTPLPIWRCDLCGTRGDRLLRRAVRQGLGRELPGDPTTGSSSTPTGRSSTARRSSGACPECGGGTMGRVEEVIDAWFDSGAMPFAQHHYPFENRELFDPEPSASPPT
jgi:isoleucyl-tRNA synthetase